MMVVLNTTILTNWKCIDIFVDDKMEEDTPDIVKSDTKNDIINPW